MLFQFAVKLQPSRVSHSRVFVRVSIAQNTKLTSETALKAFVSKFPNLNEFNMSGTKISGVDHTTFEKNNNLFHLKAINTPSSCFGTQLSLKLEAAMKRNMKRF